ncbi:MAG: hypothetical protein AAF570_13200, partial [Bacteroidota bacterium]
AELEMEVNKGWFLPTVVANAWQNEGEDITGYYFYSPVHYSPESVDAGGNAAWLRALLLCQKSEIEMALSEEMLAAAQKSKSEINALLQARGVDVPAWWGETHVKCAGADQPGKAGEGKSFITQIDPSRYLNTAVVVGGFLESFSDFGAPKQKAREK